MVFSNYLTSTQLKEVQSILETSEEAAAVFIQSKLNVKSKKKRIQLKIKRKIANGLSHLKQNPSVEPITEIFKSEININGLPVTFLLKIGKEFYHQEPVVKYYYSKTHPDFYKNKELLLEVLEKVIRLDNPNIQIEIMQRIEDRRK